MFRSPNRILVLVCALCLSVGLFAPVALAQTAACNQTYIVQKGDWLSTIAGRYLGDSQAYQTILDATNAAAKLDPSFGSLTNPNLIVAGQKLCIPPATAIPGRENAGTYTNVGPAADASALVEILTLGADGQVRDTLDYVGKAEIDGKGTWKQDGETITVHMYAQAGKAVDQTSTYTVKDKTLVGTNAPNEVYSKTDPAVVFYSGVYTTNRKSADGKETLTAMTLLPNGTAQVALLQGDTPVMLTGTWSVAENPDTKTDAVTVDVKDANGNAEHFVFQPQGSLLRGTEYNSDKWGTSLTFTKVHDPAQPVTAAQGPGPVIPSAAGTYTAVGPAADASALVQTLVLTDDFKAMYINDYVGKARTTETGTWTTKDFNYVVTLTLMDGKPNTDTLTLQLKDGNLVSAGPPATTFVKTAPQMILLSGVYTSGRKSADGKETLVALTLLPNGTAQVTINQGDTPVLLTGTWTVGKNADTGTDMVTVKVTDPNGKAEAESFTFQVQNNLLRGTQYNVDKWGTDLTFGKAETPTEPQTPASVTPTPAPATGGLAPITGNYSQMLPAADAIGRVIELSLNPDNSAALTTQFIGKGAPTVEKGTWENASVGISVALDTSAGAKAVLNFKFDQGALVLQDPQAAGYGSDGLTLMRMPSGVSHDIDYGGVSLRYDAALAQTAAGSTLKAVPVTEGPALGGASPAAVQIWFGDQKQDDFFNPHAMQVLVYKADDWTKLDPSTAKTVADLRALLATKPVSISDSIPLLPVLGATQVFHAQPHYLDFQNGTGVAFLTYYAQDVSPVTADQPFYTFQGLTNDGKYYIAAFAPATTALLPKDPTAALGGLSYDEWAKQYQTYLDTLVASLNGLIPAAYTPNLGVLDDMFKTINVSDKTLE